MELERNGVKIEIDFRQLSEAELAVATAEVDEANALRRIDLSVPAGNVAVEGANADAATDEVVTPETLTPVTPESLAEQLTTAYKGYETVANLLNNGRQGKDHVEIADQETVARELKAWATEDKLAYVAKAMEADPKLHFTLVATPNVVAKADEIIKMAIEFGKDQRSTTYVWSEIYGLYSSEQLSGTDPCNGSTVKFSLIPNKLDYAMAGTVPNLLFYLEQLQADAPYVGVPSVLENITFWNTLRASGDSLATGGAFEKTYIRHFDLPAKCVGNFWYVPRSNVSGHGGPNLDGSNLGYGSAVRVSVG